MSVFPNFGNIDDSIRKVINSRKSVVSVSELNAYVRVTSFANPGMTLYSNPNVSLFGAAGIYGDGVDAGISGMTLGLKPFKTEGENAPLRPTPIITSLEIDEGAGNLSRKATFSITCFSKSQMQLLSEFYLEPGFSIFLEWGWNTANGASGLVKSLKADNVSNFQSFKKTDDQRIKGGYEYDNYLGFNTGGSLAVDGDKWTINVKCTGYTELPSYLLASHNSTDGPSGGATNKLIARPVYGEASLEKVKGNAGLERWMRCYNELPGTRQTKWVKGLKNELAKVENFIGFDDTVAENVNETTNGKSWWQIGTKDTKKVNGKDVDFPEGTEVVSKEKFIKFSALMKIFFAIGQEGYYLGKKKKKISFVINTNDTVCSAFQNIFSTDSTKLFIPNAFTPSMDLATISDKEPDISALLTGDKKIVDNTVAKIVKFPNSYPCNETQEGKASNLEIPAYQWGYLRDLYVNFEFAKSVMDTSNFFIKDAIYQILNGMSSAVNGMWDFQMNEHPIGDDTTELRIFEMNAISSAKLPSPYVFNISGPESVFIDASFDLDIGGAKMNQIIGAKAKASMNADASVIPRGVFGNRVDMIKPSIEDSDDPGDDDTIDKNAMKEANLNMILGKLSFYPKVELTENTSIPEELYDGVYLGAFNDSAIFTALKNNTDLDSEKSDIGPLMPINFSFKMHGVSGIKRGDMFNVNGIPDLYYKRGFFQVLSVKHAIEGMLWTTEITGGFRPKRG
jgi:hypothetical protein